MAETSAPVASVAKPEAKPVAKPAAKKHYKSKNDWAADYFKRDLASGKFVCQFHDDAKDKKCGFQFGEKTAKQNWVEHLLNKHHLELPKQFTTAAKPSSQLALTTFLATKESPGVQVERLVVAYCMNPRVALSTMDDPYWKAAHKDSHPN